MWYKISDIRYETWKYRFLQSSAARQKIYLETKRVDDDDESCRGFRCLTVCDRVVTRGDPDGRMVSFGADRERLNKIRVRTRSWQSEYYHYNSAHSWMIYSTECEAENRIFEYPDLLHNFAWMLACSHKCRVRMFSRQSYQFNPTHINAYRIMNNTSNCIRSRKPLLWIPRFIAYFCLDVGVFK